MLALLFSTKDTEIAIMIIIRTIINIFSKKYTYIIIITITMIRKIIILLWNITRTKYNF